MEKIKKILKAQGIKNYNKALSNRDLENLVKDPNFRGWFMRDQLKDKIPKEIESGILNLDHSKNPGTHWVCWIKNKNLIIYFDSYGTSIPLELLFYLRKAKNYQKVYCSTLKVQPDNTVICGHLCVYVINEQPKTLEKFLNIIFNLLS